jgi:hypothetical protein
MCSAEHCGNYRNSLTYTLDHSPYVGTRVLSLIDGFLVKAALIKTIIPLFKKLSIIFYAVSKKYYGVKESQTLFCWGISGVVAISFFIFKGVAETMK